MKRFSLPPFICISVCVFGLLLAVPAPGSIVVVADYRFGDIDPGAVVGSIVNSTTLDSTGNGFTLNLAGSATYVTTPTGIGISLNGTAPGFSRSVVSTLTNDFGIEVLVSSDNTPSAAQVIFYNGDPTANGWGLYQAGGTWGALLGGLFFQGTAVVANQWVTLALVRSGGTTTFYVNGVAQYTTGITPNVPTGSLAAGNASFNIPGAGYFAGDLDRGRVFTFAPGAFSTSDLLVPLSVPEPSTWTMIGVGLAFAQYVRGKKRRGA